MIFDFFFLIEGIALWIITSILAYFLGSIRRIKNFLKKRGLKQFFGKNAKEPDRINIIIPVLQPMGEVIDGKVIYHYKKYFDKEEKTWSGPENVMAVEDVRAAASLMSLLKPLTPQTLEPITDKEKLDGWDRCLICIGSPLSNAKAEHLMEDIDPSVVSWVEVPKDPYNQRLRVHGELFISTQKKDYGLILKIENKHSKGDFVFIIAGITQFGTKETARYLKEKWKKLNNKADRKPFICVIKVDKREDMKRVEEVHFTSNYPPPSLSNNIIR